VVIVNWKNEKPTLCNIFIELTRIKSTEIYGLHNTTLAISVFKNILDAVNMTKLSIKTLEVGRR